jgi:hypothetical protein
MLDTVRKTTLFQVGRTIYEGARRQMFGEPTLFDRIVMDVETPCFNDGRA